MGALLALRLAAIAPGRVATVVCMGTPLVLKPYQRWGIRALGHLARVPGLDTLTARIAKPSRTDCSIRSVAAQYPGFDAFPRSSLLELLRLQATVRPLLSQVRCPTMLIHGQHDHSAPVSNVQYAASRLTSASTTTKVLSRSFHQIAWDVDATECATSISMFIKSHYPPTATAP
jgi:pimeloyl-ACP methyl ester carboxylesterase